MNQTASASEIDSICKIIDTFPAYLNLYQKYMKGEKVAKELDELYRPIFSQIMVPYYMEIMPNIQEIVSLIEKKYSNIVNEYAIIDYIEFLCGNIYYETFVFELGKIPVKDIKTDHLIVFKYILYVEYVKYKIYQQILSTIPLDSKFRPAMTKRKDFVIKKINYTIDLIEKKYMDSHNDFFNECKQIVTNDFKIDLSNEYFPSSINYLNLCK